MTHGRVFKVVQDLPRQPTDGVPFLSNLLSSCQDLCCDVALKSLQILYLRVCVCIRVWPADCLTGDPAREGLVNFQEKPQLKWIVNAKKRPMFGALPMGQNKRRRFGR